MKDNQIRIFSTPIWGFILGSHKHQSVDYLNVILNLEKTEESVKKSNFGGFQTHDDLHKLPVFREFTKALEFIASECLEHPARVVDMWGNINYKNSYNGNHTHGNTLSGVFYLKVPKDSGRLILCNPAVRSDAQFIRESNYPIVPEPLALILFPSWLEHYVEPNLSEETRVSISFNFELVK